ncbi:signal transduction protein [Nitrosopumilus sp. b1]|uniref:CBS domain-containing protein n=1 Tax=Nitrosopumilus sp. b1 TaxID=2109907 RepID=UPI0015F4747C|nr:CBS domain-containing protein [Nitrosopumilus sp. b1]KAF6242413.1 signal transduction protein [Nitrosopumilus sp. b1]
MEQKIPVKKIMVKNIVSVDSSQTIEDVAKKLYEKRVGSAIVIEDNKPIGIITNRDIVSSIGSFEMLLNAPAKKIMSTPLIHVKPDDSIIDVAEIMTSKNIRKIPVIVNDQVLGIVSASDLVAIFTMLKKEDLLEIFRPYLKD